MAEADYEQRMRELQRSYVDFLDDSDRDGIPDIIDNCVAEPNADQLDTGTVAGAANWVNRLSQSAHLFFQK